MKKLFLIITLSCAALTGCSGIKALDRVDAGLVPKESQIGYVHYSPDRPFCPAGATYCSSAEPSFDDLQKLDVLFSEKIVTVDRTGSRIMANIGWFALAVKARAPYKSLGIQDGRAYILEVKKKGEDEPTNYSCRDSSFEDCRLAIRAILGGSQEIAPPTPEIKQKVLAKLMAELQKAEQAKKEWEEKGHPPGDKYTQQMTEDIEYRIRTVREQIDSINSQSQN